MTSENSIQTPIRLSQEFVEKILKKVAPDMGGVSAIFEESWSVMTLPTTSDDPDCYAEGTGR